MSMLCKAINRYMLCPGPDNAADAEPHVGVPRWHHRQGRAQGRGQRRGGRG